MCTQISCCTVAWIFCQSSCIFCGPHSLWIFFLFFVSIFSKQMIVVQGLKARWSRICWSRKLKALLVLCAFCSGCMPMISARLTLAQCKTCSSGNSFREPSLTSAMTLLIERPNWKHGYSWVHLVRVRVRVLRIRTRGWLEKKKGKGAYSSLWEPITELRSITCHVGSHSVTCHPTQVNVPCLNPSPAGRYSIYLPPERWKGELTLVVGIYQDGLPVHRQSPIQLITTW